MTSGSDVFHLKKDAFDNRDTKALIWSHTVIRNIQCTDQCRKCTVYRSMQIVYRVQISVENVQCTDQCRKCTVYKSMQIVYSVQISVESVQCTDQCR